PAVECRAVAFGTAGPRFPTGKRHPVFPGGTTCGGLPWPGRDHRTGRPASVSALCDRTPWRGAFHGAGLPTLPASRAAAGRRPAGEGFAGRLPEGRGDEAA